MFERVKRFISVLTAAALGGCATLGPRPVAIRPLVQVGGTETCVVRDDGTAHCWGLRTDDRRGGEEVASSQALRTLEVGVFEACGLSVRGETLCTERLGGTVAEECEATICLAPLQATRAPFVQVSTGYYHACALDPGGRAWCWGGNGMGQLGNAARAPDPGASGGERVLVPTPVVGSLRFVAISAGEMHSCALMSRGDVYCWGYGQSGELGRDTVMTGCSGDVPLQNAPCSVDRPVRVQTSVRFKAISAGMRMTCALSRDDAVWCWGPSARCALATCGTADSSDPVRIPLPARAASVDAGYWFACAVTMDRRAYCWGNDASGQLGSLVQAKEGDCWPGGMCTPIPTEVSGNHRWRSVSAGESHACGVRMDGEVMCWGELSEGRLAGYGGDEICRNASEIWKDVPCASTPVLIPRLTGSR